MSFVDWKPSGDFRSDSYYNHLIFVITFKERTSTSDLGRVQAFRYLWKQMHLMWKCLGCGWHRTKDLKLRCFWSTWVFCQLQAAPWACSRWGRGRSGTNSKASDCSWLLWCRDSHLEFKVFKEFNTWKHMKKYIKEINEYSDIYTMIYSRYI